MQRRTKSRYRFPPRPSSGRARPRRLSITEVEKPRRARGLACRARDYKRSSTKPYLYMYKCAHPACVGESQRRGRTRRRARPHVRRPALLMASLSFLYRKARLRAARPGRAGSPGQGGEFTQVTSGLLWGPRTREWPGKFCAGSQHASGNTVVRQEKRGRSCPSGSGRGSAVCPQPWAGAGRASPLPAASLHPDGPPRGGSASGSGELRS